MYNPHDTIAAIATARGGAARGMVRVSGANVPSVLAACFVPAEGAALGSVDRPTAILGTLHVPAALPCDVYFWPDERSYTREPVAEFHTIGSPPLLDAVLHSVCRAGARLAEPGEFRCWA
jgi:tRNA modification GTPase